MKRSPISPYSQKHRAKVAAYRKAREAVQERSEGRCEARAFGGCTGTGEQAHHVLRRSQGGTDTPGNLLWLCAFCHGWVHEHPKAAEEKGLLRSRVPDELEPAEDLAPCICGRMSRSVPCYRCELEDDRDAG